MLVHCLQKIAGTLEALPLSLKHIKINTRVATTSTTINITT